MTAATLPPGPRLAPLNMLGWVTRPIPFMEHCRARYGERFTRAIADFKIARPPGGIDLVRLYEENLIDGVVYERPPT